MNYKELVWEWDWLLYAPTAKCPFCKDGHSSGCFCPKQIEGINEDSLPCEVNKFWKSVEEAEKRDLAPKHPTKQQILDQVENIKKCAKKNLNSLFPFTESRYYEVVKYAKQLKVEIPTYVELCKEIGIEPIHNTKTGAEFQKEIEERDVDITFISYDGWESEEAFHTEKISWVEFCDRRDRSDCNYIKSKSRKYYRIKDALVGQKIYILSGKFYDKYATVIEQLGSTTIVSLDDDQKTYKVYSGNEARRVHPQQYYVDQFIKYGFVQQGKVISRKRELDEDVIDLVEMTYYNSKDNYTYTYKDSVNYRWLENILTDLYYQDRSNKNETKND